MQKLNINGYEFNFLCELLLKRNFNNEIWINEKPHVRYKNINKIHLNQYGEGIFCKFKIPQGFKGSKCVYVFTLDNTPIYIGKTINLENRFNNGYGNISPRNCFISGQSTNCRLNQLVLDLYLKGNSTKIWYYVTENHKEIEKILIETFNPKWNIQFNKKLKIISNQTKVVTKSKKQEWNFNNKKENIMMYDGLKLFLNDYKLTLTFKQIEMIIGRELPSIARRNNAWWGNNIKGHTQARAWMETGWRVYDINRKKQLVTFKKV